MKMFRSLRSSALALSAAAAALNTVLGASSEINPLPSPIDTFAVVDRGPNHAVWQSTKSVTNLDGEITYTTNNYTELSVGLNKRGNDGTWAPASDQIQINPNGGATADGGQHTAYFPGSLYNDGFVVNTPDGKTLLSRPLGLSYFDGDQSVLIADLKDSAPGQLLPSGNEILYPDICTDVDLDLLTTYKLSGFESDLIIRQQLPDPSVYGFPDASLVRVQWLTEFFDPPTPQKTVTQLADGGTDEFLDFGSFKMPPGKGFLVGNEAMGVTRVPISKQWTVIEARTFLIEEIPLNEIAPYLASLPLRTAALPSPARRHELVAGHALPQIRPIKHSPKSVLIAQSDFSSKPGFYWDYDLSGSVTNFTFQSDTTYYLPNPSAVNLYGTTVIEGGTVIKVTNSPSAQLTVLGPVVCSTGPYRMAMLTSANDDSVGTTISTSTGTPSNYLAGIYISSGITGSPTYTNSYRYIRFSYAGTALRLQDVSKDDVWHCQFVKCATALDICSGCSASFYGAHNALFTTCGNVANAQFIGEHLTADSCNLFPSSGYAGTFTNCLFTAVTNIGTSSVDHCVTNNSAAGFYQTAGAGNYYLIGGSTNRNGGSTNITASLRTDLSQKTTYPPLIYSNITNTADTILSAQAQRDSDIPDIGYHYETLDFITSGFALTNCALTIGPGTSIASYNQTGIWLQEGSSFTSIGTPLAPNWFVRFQCVQEQPVALGGIPSAGFGVNPLHTGSPAPTGLIRFSRFVCPSNGGNHFTDGNWSFGTLQLQDSEVWGGVNKLDGALNTTAVVQNNLFNRGALTIWSTKTNSLSISNNLFWAVTSFAIQPVNSNLWTTYNNLFDSCAFNGLQSAVVASGYNAYYNCNKQLTPTHASDITLGSTISYQVGPIGNFYQVTNSPLIDKGSCTADLAGLYHYTTCTNIVSGNEIKETNSVVDIGLHYIALNSNNQVIDSDSDGTPDYLEDANGNGRIDSGETDWNSANDPGLKVLITRPKSGSPLP